MEGVDRRAARRALLKQIGVLASGALVSCGAPLASRATMWSCSHRRSAHARRADAPGAHSAAAVLQHAGMSFCLEVRRNYLAPRLKDDAGRLLIREVDITSPRASPRSTAQP